MRTRPSGTARVVSARIRSAPSNGVLANDAVRGSRAAIKMNRIETKPSVLELHKPYCKTKTEGTKEKTLEIGVITGERHILFNGRPGTASHNKLECVRSNCGEEDAFERSRVS
eukprot:scaffold48560_cov61-Phaeocystis_antarctica.AAC.1